MSFSSDGMDAFAEYMDGMLADLSPAKRKWVARKIGAQLRRSNAKRIRSNVEPDGTKMEPRKRKRKIRRGQKFIRSGKMFRNIGKGRSFKVHASEDGVRVQIANPIANVHHYGEEGYVGRTRDGRTIRARYHSRQLLGFGREDLDEMTDALLKWLDRV